jgi:hypothetical protein
MHTYYLKLKVQPTLANEQFTAVEGAFACCWLKEASIDAAYRKAIFYIKKSDWKIEGIEILPTLVIQTDFNSKEAIENYNKAQIDGMSFVYVGWSRDGISSYGPIELNSSLNFDLDIYLSRMKKEQMSGRCLHYDAGVGCNKISKAHSIQENQMLSKIQIDGHVYTLDSSITSLKKNKGKLSYKKTGINVFSIFRGFCGKHDNELFKSIDSFPLIPTDQQVFLYAYRSLCKALFDKENALNTCMSQMQKGFNLSVVNELLDSMALGTRSALENLKLHKIRFDESLKSGRFEKIRYVLFVSDKSPNIVFTGGIFPDFDFNGRQLQNLANYNSSLELITFCSAPINSGWGYLFAWHESNSKVCEEYIKSLATAIYEKQAVEDFLFRLAISSENHAFHPTWWENLSSEYKDKIVDKTSETINIFSKVQATYLTKGIEGISGWKFDRILQNY